MGLFLLASGAVLIAAYLGGFWAAIAVGIAISVVGYVWIRRQSDRFANPS
jgi:hypothetical protein